MRLHVRDRDAAVQGTQFTGFTSTKVQILTQRGGCERRRGPDVEL